MEHSSQLRQLFELQLSMHLEIGKRTAKERIQRLETLADALQGSYRQKFRDALWADFRKPPLETDLTEIYPVLREIRHIKKKLRSWMGKQTVHTPLTLLGSRSYYYYEPKGVCLIIAPWNFPVNLTFAPLVSAIAAGNTVILKPSEMTPHTAAVMKSMVQDLFPEEEVALVEGDAEAAKALLELPFHHIFFTGSPAIGKKVMAAASKNLSSITLELGGKSPVIVDATADLERAAERITWGKFTNAGQICVSPDYMLVHEEVKEALTEKIREKIRTFYTQQGNDMPAYAHVVNKKHYDRLEGILEDAVDKGAHVVDGGQRDPETHYFAPTLLDHVPRNARIMEEEIFGPLFPIQSYTKMAEAVEYINSMERPLALYIFSKDRKAISYVLQNTRAGSTAINSTVLQYANNHLPFGGVNNSGVGNSHSIFGFQEFSNLRSVLNQGPGLFIRLAFPPYSSIKEKLATLMMRWF